MQTLAEIETLAEARKAFRDSIRNLDDATVALIVSDSSLPDDASPLLRYSRAAWTLVHSFDHRGVDLRSLRAA